MLKVLSEEFREAIVFRVSPDMRIEPVQLLRRTPPNGIAQNRFIRVEDGKLFQEFLRFSQSVGRFEDCVAANRARYRCHELKDHLVRQTHGVLNDAAPENPGCNPLLFYKPVIEPVDQDVGINESGHACRDPLFSIRGRQAGRWQAPIAAFCGAG